MTIEGRKVEQAEVESLFRTILPRGAADQDVTYAQALHSLDLDADGRISIAHDSEKLLSIDSGIRNPVYAIRIFSQALDELGKIETEAGYPGAGVLEYGSGESVMISFAQRGYPGLYGDEVYKYHQLRGSTTCAGNCLTSVGIEPLRISIRDAGVSEQTGQRRVRLSVFEIGKGDVRSIEIPLCRLTDRDSQFQMLDNGPHLISRDLKRYLWDFMQERGEFTR